MSKATCSQYSPIIGYRLISLSHLREVFEILYNKTSDARNLRIIIRVKEKNTETAISFPMPQNSYFVSVLGNHL
jgi:hypothetical protein